MKRFIRSLILLIILLILIAGCGVKPPPVPIPVTPSPDIRVGLLEHVPEVDFTTNASCDILHSNGVVFQNNMMETEWKVVVEKSVPAITAYRLVAGSFKEIGKARQEADRIDSMGFQTIIRPIGRPLQIGGLHVTSNRRYRIYLNKEFLTRESAMEYQQRLMTILNTFVSRETIQPSKGVLKLIPGDNGQEYIFTKPFIIKSNRFTFDRFPVGQGYHWENSEERIFQGEMEFQIGTDGQLLLINHLPLEEYIKGVIPAEMPASFPLEALKAQAVAARGKVLGAWGLVHQDDPYDVCATVHCQVYSGIGKQSTTTNRAAHETAGLVMFKDDEIVDAIFCGVCGGHTEDVDKAWGGEPYDYLKGRYDGGGSLNRYGDLSNHRNAENWIDHAPDTYCNTKNLRVPDSMNYTKKYFRWEKDLSQAEIQQALAAFFKEPVGPVLEIIPLQRGVSGRITRLKIVTPATVKFINGELNIRKALCPTTLWSACFYVLNKDYADQIPGRFVLHGAGWGHGVGMCQTGAAVQALKHKKYDQILKYYYKGIKIRKLY